MAALLRSMSLADKDDAMVRIKMRLDRQGGLVVPVELCRTAGLDPGSEVVLEAAGGEVHIRHAGAALARVQEKYKRLARGRRVVDEFLTERRD
jgi:bifunctional DNA-binding transcriptional regulator/antitoxin component of YhaV-PrlF toxin-antitoxin module